MPLRDRHLARHRNDEGVREHEIGDPHMRVGVADPAQRDDAHAVVGRLDLDLRARMLAHDARHRHVGIDRLVAEQLAVALVRILVVEEAMQERGVRRIDADLERLQPVAVDHALEREGVASPARRSSRNAEIPAARPGPDRRTGCRSSPPPDRPSAGCWRTCGCLPARPASPGTGRSRRTASRGRRSAGRRPRAARTRDRCRDAGSARSIRP